jgi:sugar lactone lactonase YvrE
LHIYVMAFFCSPIYNQHIFSSLEYLLCFPYILCFYLGVSVRLTFVFFMIFFTSLCFSQTFIELGRFGGQGKETGHFNNPLAIGISIENIVYVVDTGNHRIQLFDLKGHFIKSIGGFGFKDDQFDAPHDIWVKSLINIYVADYNNRRLQRYDRNMNFISSLKSNEGEDSDFQFFETASCAVSSQNDLFVLDHDEFKIIKFKRDGNAERSFGRFDSGAGELNTPEQIDFWGSDKLLVSDSGEAALMIFDLFGNFIQKIRFDEFKNPTGIGVDNNKNIYVADPAAGKLFYIKNDLSLLTQIDFPLGFKAPQDVAVITKDSKTLLFVIDENEIVIGSLDLENSPSSKKGE